jgi:Fic family protein
MTGKPTFDGAMALLADPAFSATAREASRSYLSPSEIAARPLPEGLSAEESCELIAVIRRLGATVFPIPAAGGEEFWYTLTVDSRRCLRDIERHCRSDSRLHQMVQRRTGQQILVNAQIHEAIATCWLDGVAADEAELESMLQQGRPPKTPVGRLVKNTYEMLGELESLVEEDFSPELVTHLFDRVTHGVDLAAMARPQSSMRGVTSVFQEVVKEYRPPGIGRFGEHSEERSAAALEELCHYANGTIGDTREAVAAKGHLLVAAMGYWHPLPDFNATVARHLLRLHAMKQDYPVLGYLPVNVMTRRWALGQLAPGTVRYDRIEPRTRSECGIDGTAEILVHLQLTVAALQDMLARVQSSKIEDEVLKQGLSDGGRFNYRQRAVLTHALRCPEAEFTFREYRLTHRTVYSTARADLLELAELGLLDKQLRDPAFVFTPATDLRERLGRPL